MPAIFICLAALLTWPWTLWVVEAAYERDINQKVDRTAQRVKIHLSNPASWQSAQQLLEPIKSEVLSDDTVQAVCFFDYGRHFRSGVGRPNVELPQSLEDVQRMLHSDPNHLRRAAMWEQADGKGLRGVIYLDLSVPEVKKQFWTMEGPLIKKVGWQTFIAFLVVSGVGIMAYRFWGSAERQRERAELEQQGQLAERGLAAA